jgi:hypothetical protein
MTPRFLFVALCAAITAAASLTGGAVQPAAPTLVLEAADAAPAERALAALAAAPGSVQSRAVVVNLAALDADAVDIAVSPGRTLRAVLAQRTALPGGGESWSGQVADAPFSAATFVRAGAILQGSIRTLDAAYSIEPIGGTGLHAIRELDLAQLGPELPPRVPPALPAALDEPPREADDGAIFDVLVLYTPAARTAAGGTDGAIQSRINLGVTETNTAYVNSGIVPRLRLVGAELVSYTERGDLSLDLDALTNPSDGFMDAVHARRDALGADLVKLVVGDAAAGACGVAWLMNTLTTGFAVYAFSVTAYPCISPNYTFGHELGHNMGSNHAPDDGANSTPLYPYSFGYKHPSNLFRTMMAYNCGGSGCPRILYFSNPSVLYNGSPTGTVPQHNNALSINNARTTVANFRQAVAVNTAPTITAFANRTIPEDTSTGTIPFTIGDAQTASGSLVVTAMSSNPAVVANTPAGLALGGTASARTLAVTPQPDANGYSTISVTVSDGSLSATSTFVLTVTSENDPPVVSAIGAQTMNEDESLSIPFTVTDVDNPASALVVQASSANTALINASGIALGGSGQSRVLTLTPVANESGLAAMTVTVSDGTASAQRTFTVTVTPVNDAPAFVSLPPLVSTTVGQPTTFTVALTDPDTSGSAIALGVASNNPVVLPQSGVLVVPVSSTASSRTFQVTLTPALGQTGTSLLTFTASDGLANRTAPVSFSVTAVASAPDPPTALSATASGTDVTFSWAPALTGTVPTSFTLEIGTAAGTTTLPTQSVPWPTTRLTLPLPGGTYHARVRAVNGIGSSTPSPEATIVVDVPTPIPGPPGNFSATVSDRTVSFLWTASSAGMAATSYTIEAGSAPGLSDLARLVTGTPATSLSVPNVPPGTYWVRVRGSNDAGTGAPSQDVAIVMGATSGCAGLPGSPVLLTPVIDGFNVSLNWNTPSFGGRVMQYVLFAGSAPGLSNLAVVNTGNAASSFAASAPAGVYYVRVAASNACGTGPLSNEVTFSIDSAIAEAPIDLAATVGSNGFVSLTWSPPASGVSPSGYLLEAGSAPGMSDLATLATGSTATAFSATAQPGRYYVRVRALTTGGPGPASNEVVVDVP